MNLCGETLRNFVAKTWPDEEVEPRPKYDPYCNEQRAAPELMRHGPATFVVALFCVVMQVAASHFVPQTTARRATPSAPSRSVALL